MITHKNNEIARFNIAIPSAYYLIVYRTIFYHFVQEKYS